MNWGWHETICNTYPATYTDYNGWFDYNNWNIAGANNGNGQDVNFQYYDAAITEIHP